MSDHDVTLTVDGTEEELTVEARTLLVHALRDELGYTAPKVGCESGTCGACTVHLGGEAVKSCTVLAVQADGGEVTTAAGLADAATDGDGAAAADGATDDDAATDGDGAAGGDDARDHGDVDDLHPVQTAFHEEHGLQCGYCTPGMVMTVADLLADRPDPAREEIRDALKGNVCRCTGYHNVVDAVESAAEKLEAGDGAALTDGGGAAPGGAGRRRGGDEASTDDGATTDDGAATDGGTTVEGGSAAEGR